MSLSACFVTAIYLLTTPEATPYLPISFTQEKVVKFIPYRGISVTSPGETGDISEVFQDTQGKIWIKAISQGDKSVHFFVFTGNIFVPASPESQGTTLQGRDENGDIISQTMPDGTCVLLRAHGNRAIVATSSGIWENNTLIYPAEKPILSLDATRNGAIAAGTADALLLRETSTSPFRSVYPADSHYSWAPVQVGAVAWDSKGRLWFGCKGGAGMLENGQWHLYTGAEGLPYDHFTCARSGDDGSIWFGTTYGAIRYDGKRWDYYANLRWLPDNHVNDILLQPDGTAWLATCRGVSRICRFPMTLEEKADYFVDQVETRHNRDGYITPCALTRRGDITSAVPAITDNDGCYTARYGAAMAFKYALTHDENAKQLAQRSFRACKFLVDVVPDTMNGANMKGFPARVAIPYDWHEPVNEQYGAAYNNRRRYGNPEKGDWGDPFWKLITPRFPLSKDGKWRWKCDTSSDELAGHYFFYSIYYDLVAQTEEEKAPVREVVAAITDHLVRNDFNLVDHDGKPTRWGRFGPDYLDTVYGWTQRGLNSLMLLSFLSVADHITGNPKYNEIAQLLKKDFSYHISAMTALPSFPPENVVPWDKNLALECFYPLIHYEKDPELLLMYRESLENAWRFSSKQKNAYWNLIYVACAKHFNKLAEQHFFDNAFPDAGPYTKVQVAKFSSIPLDEPIQDALDTLECMPLELLGWQMNNSHRLDIVLDNTPGQEPHYGWSRVDGKALPIDERGHVRQDRDAFVLDQSEGNGWDEHEGTFFLLPYYLGRYHQAF